MAAYKNTRTFEEDGNGTVSDVLIFAETYAELAEIDDATEVDIFDTEGDSEALDSTNSVYQSSELKFTIKETSIWSEDATRTADNQDARDFVLTAQATGSQVFCARLINGTTPTASADEFAFRGTVRSDMEADDDDWTEGDEYDTDFSPLRTWNCTAQSFDVGTLLSQKVRDVVWLDPDPDVIGVYGKLIDSDWEAAHVADRLAYFFRDIDRYGLREVRFGNIVALSDVLDKLFELISVNGVTLTYEATDTDLYTWPAFYLPILKEGPTDPLDLCIRYCDSFFAGLTTAVQVPRPWRLLGSNTFLLRTGGTDYGTAPWINYNLIYPNQDEEPLSWWRYTVVELLYSLAYGFGMFLDIEYTDTTHATVKFTSRASLGVRTVAIRDGLSGKIKLSSVSPTEAADATVGVGAKFVIEGPEYYLYEKGLLQAHPTAVPPTEGNFLALTVSPCWCFMTDTGEDAGADMASRYGRALLPHNAVFYDAGSPKNGTGTDGKFWPEYDARSIHTGLYVKTVGLDQDAYKEIGVEGEDTWRQVARVVAKIDGKFEYFDTLTAYTARVYQRDQNFYEGEYTIVVPGLMGFTNDLNSTPDWRNIRPGHKFPFGGVDWVVMRINRKKTETEITVHHFDQFAGFASASGSALNSQPSPSALAPVDTKPRAVTNALSVTPGVGISALQLVAVDAVGGAVEAEATEAFYNRPLRLALTMYESETDPDATAIQVAERGKIWQDTYTLTPGAKLFLRSGVPNWTEQALTGANGSERLFLQIGTVDADGETIILDPHYPGFLFE